jgi:hypothetical protein
MKTLAVSSVSFGASNINNNNRHEHQPENNEPTVTIPRSKYEELRRAAAKGVMAVTMATAVLAGGASVTSCSKSDDVPEVNIQTDKIDLEGQKILMNMLQTVGVPITTNETNPKYISTFSVSDIVSDVPVIGNCNDLKGDWTYNDKLSTKDKSVYNSKDDKQLVVTKEDSNSEYKLNGEITQPGKDPITIKLKKNDDGGLSDLRIYADGDSSGDYKKSTRGLGWVSCDEASLYGDIHISALAK